MKIYRALGEEEQIRFSKNKIPKKQKGWVDSFSIFYSGAGLFKRTHFEQSTKKLSESERLFFDKSSNGEVFSGKFFFFTKAEAMEWCTKHYGRSHILEIDVPKAILAKFVGQSAYSIVSSYDEDRARTIFKAEICFPHSVFKTILKQCKDYKVYESSPEEYEVIKDTTPYYSPWLDNFRAASIKPNKLLAIEEVLGKLEDEIEKNKELATKKQSKAVSPQVQKR